MLVLGISNSLFRKCTQPESLVELALRWIGTESPVLMLEFLTAAGVRFGEGKRPRRPNVDHVVALCENALAFEGVMVIAAIIEALRIDNHEDDELVRRLEHVQKRLKYGLLDRSAILVHELGFADRVIATDLAEILGSRATTKRRLIRIMRENQDSMTETLAAFPSYYSFVWNNVLNTGR
jgi:POLQ-like helicase